MQPMTPIRVRGLFLAAGLAFASAASAEEAPSSRPPTAEAQAETDAVLSAEDLEALAGGTGVSIDMLTDQTLTAINAGNRVIGQTVGSGQINVENGGLADFNGIGNFVFNTGHNNNLQSSMNVSIVLAP
ncbi:MAG: hypothetical protein WDM79_16515 [Terricaulis sp.]